MTENQFEEFLKKAARDYNRPAETPRKAMWARIEEARRARRDAHKVVFLASPWLRWGAGIAAALLLGVGIGMNLDRLSTGTSSETAVVAEGTRSGGATERNDIYRLVTLEHLGRAEVFLTMFRADVRTGRTDYQMSNPARDLLTTTRLLQGSPASEDARFRELLDDLELVLVQIAQLRIEQNGKEADLVAHGMDQQGVLLRLRAAAPAGTELLGAQGVL